MKISEINRKAIWENILGLVAGIAAPTAGAMISSDAAKDAAKEQTKAAKMAIDLQREMYLQSREDLSPWREGGEAAINELRRRLGLGYYEPILDASGQPIRQANQITRPAVQRTFGDPTPDRAFIAPIKPPPAGIIPAAAPETAPIPAATPAPETAAPVQEYVTVKQPIYAYKKVRNPNREVGDRDKPATIRKRYIAGYRDVQVPKGGVIVSVPKPGSVTGQDEVTSPEDIDLMRTGQNMIDVRLTGEGQIAPPPGQLGPPPPTMRYVEGTGAEAGPPGYEPVPEFTESPGYQFTLSEGERAIQNALSRMGMSRSGKHLRAAVEHAEGLASTEYDNFLRRWYRDQEEKRVAFSSQINPYLAMAGMGQTSAQQTAQLGSQTAGQMGQAQIYGGEARAASDINRANALTGAITGGTNALLYYNALRNLRPQQTAAVNPLSQASSYGSMQLLTG